MVLPPRPLAISPTWVRLQHKTIGLYALIASLLIGFGGTWSVVGAARLLGEQGVWAVETARWRWLAIAVAALLSLAMGLRFAIRGVRPWRRLQAWRHLVVESDEIELEIVGESASAVGRLYHCEEPAAPTPRARLTFFLADGEELLFSDEKRNRLVALRSPSHRAWCELVPRRLDPLALTAEQRAGIEGASPVN